jgi:uncharacterized protein (DUF433 family)
VSFRASSEAVQRCSSASSSWRSISGVTLIRKDAQDLAARASRRLVGHPVAGGRPADRPASIKGMTFERITTDPAVMGGVPCIRGLRIPVATVLTMVADGMTTEEITTELPDLAAEDVAESLRYAAQAVRERELPLRHTA